MSRAHWTLTSALLGALVLALYGRVLGYPLLYDDVSLIATNTALASLGTLPEALSKDLFHFADGVRPSPYWRPVVTLSYYLDQALGGGDPGAFHFTNLVALLAATLGLCGLLARRGLGFPGVLVLGALFLAHPLQVEGAANVAGRTDLLCAALGLWSLQVRRPWLAGGLVLAACGAKEIGVVLPLVAWLLDPEDRRWRWQAAAVGSFLVLRMVVLSGLAIAAEDGAGPSASSLTGAGARAMFWLGRIVWPLPMGPAADLPLIGGLLAVAGWLSVLVLALVSLRHDRPQGAITALVLVPLLLVSGLAQSLPRYGDTLTVLPYAGVVWGLGHLLAKAPRSWLFGPGLLAVVLAALTVQRVPAWSSAEVLWETAHARSPNDRVVALNLARVLVDTQPRTAIAVSDPNTWPEGSRQHREAATIAARAHLALGQEHAGLAWLNQSVADDPEASWANGTACVLLASRGSSAAGGICELALRTLPEDPDVLNATGLASLRAGGPQAALPWFTKAAELAPDRAEFSANRDRAAAASAP